VTSKIKFNDLEQSRDLNDAISDLKTVTWPLSTTSQMSKLASIINVQLLNRKS